MLMVATNEAPTPKPNEPRERASVPLLAKLKVKNLKVVQCLSDKEIARQTGLTLGQVRGIVDRNRWTNDKREKTRKIMDGHAARMEAQVAEIVEAVASESEEIALAGLQRAREATTSASEYAAKDFQSWTGGVRNLVNVARQARGLDTERSAQGTTLNVFVGRFETVSDKPAEKPAIDV